MYSTQGDFAVPALHERYALHTHSDTGVGYFISARVGWVELTRWRILLLYDSKGHTGTYRANELAMTAAQQLKDPDWAMEVLTTGNEKRKKSSVTAHAIAIRVLAEAGRLEEACVLLQVTKYNLLSN